MHDMIMKLGQAALDLFVSLKDAAYITLVGWLGIFAVMGVIILVVYLLNKIKS